MIFILLDYAKTLLQLNRHDPKFYYTVEDTLKQLRQLEYSNLEISNVYANLKDKLSPIVNQKYIELFKKYAKSEEVDILSLIRQYGIEFVLKNISIMEEFANFLDESIATGKVGFVGNKAVPVINHVANNVVTKYREKDPKTWDYAKYLERMLIYGLRTELISRFYVKDAIKIMLIVNNLKQAEIDKYWSERPANHEALTNTIILQNKYLEESEDFEIFFETKRREYLNTTEYNQRDSANLYDELVSARLIYNKTLVTPGELLEEYLELRLLGLPKEIMFYHTSEEFLQGYYEARAYTHLISKKVIKEKTLDAILNKGQGLIRNNDITSREMFIKKNLELLGKYGIISPSEFLDTMVLAQHNVDKAVKELDKGNITTAKLNLF